MDAAHLLKLAIIAAHLSGYSMPEPLQLPTLHELSTADFDSIACPGSVDKTCDVVGFYADNEHIFIDAQWLQDPMSDLDEDSVVVHELTHWLQDHHGKRGFDCPVSEIREREAYRVQNAYIQMYENKIAFVHAPLMCR